jgi:hypothetical protein
VEGHAVPADPPPSELIPDPDVVRQRLAIVLTEAALLRAQLRVCKRAQKERERSRVEALIREVPGAA